MADIQSFRLVPTPAEQRVIDAAAKEVLCDFRVGDKAVDDPANADAWGDGRTVRAKIIAALCTGENKDWSAHRGGILVFGAKVVGRLDLRAAKVEPDLMLVACYFDEELNLRDANVRSLWFDGSYMPGINGDGLRAFGRIGMRNGFLCEGKARFLGAHIEGQIDCMGGSFEDIGGEALICDGACITGGVFLQHNFYAEGEVILLNADIGGSLILDGASLQNAEGTAFVLQGGIVRRGFVF